MAGAMRVTVRTFAILRELSTDRASLELAESATVADAWAALEAAHPGLGPHREFVRAARNGAYAAWDAAVADGDEVAFLPPVSGGGPTGLIDGPIDVPALEAAVASAGHGALVTFVGRARDASDDGRRVVELEYEAYPEMAEAVLAEIAAETSTRWPDVAVAIVHRVGVVPIGEAAVAIVVAATHRSDAYEANRFVIEGIKQRLPIWKRERFADGSEWKRPGA
jgi:molybdopterin synthase catalytic subunit/molybdopterin converting factor small subunit